eukprot:scaffold188406_cov18-Tisochrysis_lutea.AAC.3
MFMGKPELTFVVLFWLVRHLTCGETKHHKNQKLAGVASQTRQQLKRGRQKAQPRQKSGRQAEHTKEAKAGVLQK